MLVGILWFKHICDGETMYANGLSRWSSGVSIYSYAYTYQSNVIYLYKFSMSKSFLVRLMRHCLSHRQAKYSDQTDLFFDTHILYFLGTYKGYDII